MYLRTKSACADGAVNTLPQFLDMSQTQSTAFELTAGRLAEAPFGIVVDEAELVRFFGLGP